MSTQLTQSGQFNPLPLAEPALTVSDESQKAWHLFSLLLSLGRPAHSFELASICTFFHAPPELVRLLCQIPSSPIHLRSDLCVTPSVTSLVAFFKLLSNTNKNLVDPPRQLKIERAYYRKRKRSSDKHELLPLTKRRVDLYPEEGIGCCSSWCSPRAIQNPCEKVHFLIKGDGIKVEGQQGNFPDVGTKPMLMSSLFANVAGQSTGELSNIQDEEHRFSVRSTYKIEEILDPEMSTKVAHQTADSTPNISHEMMKDIILSTEENKEERDFLEKENLEPSRAATKKTNASFNEIGCYNGKFKFLKTKEDGRPAEVLEEELFTGHVGCLREPEFPSPLPNTSSFDRKYEGESKKNEVACENVVLLMESRDKFPALECSTLRKPLPKQSVNSRASYGSTISSRKQVLYESLKHKRVGSVHREREKSRRSEQPINTNQKLKHVESAMLGKERKGNSPAPKDQVEVKVLPAFESYIVEEEEGSGGYGTVYRARRKKDGITVAIKYPHANAHKHHITNELKMLERFGGKNFIIRCEGSFKSGSSDCFVLEHVDHDRPEILKKEINVLQLRWYGYCLFRALASLHKQGVVHRDVKPGNFLFSRKAKKGYLIDFNLAMDLHQKHATKSKLKLRPGANFNPLPQANNKPLSPGKMKFQAVKSLDALRKDEIKTFNLPMERKSFKRKVMDQGKACNNLGSQSTASRQGAEGSGITSARDVTSTRTASAERMKEPLPRQGRKELISLLQKTMHVNCEASSVPAPMRKRIAAPPGDVDGKLVIITPMPINLTGVPVRGAGLRSNIGDCKKEGPCVGTKGFRAPEVLFRSSHQGPKLDIWSAGVSLLYLVAGKMPFLGDPEQNIKDIAKLRGSEDLWEVAKLHNREVSFPVDLYDTQHLTTANVRDWCQRYTRRTDFLKVMPISFFDLLDKCLTVNPRLRISAEEALKHEFFTPCHEELKKQKLITADCPPEPRVSHTVHRYADPLSAGDF